MSDQVEEILIQNPPPAAHKELSFTDRYLTVWILAAIVLGVLIGYLSPSSADNIDSWSTGTINWPIAVGLIVMMFPPLARVDYDKVYLLFVQHFTYDHQIESMLEYATFLTKSDPKCGAKCVCHESNSTTVPSSNRLTSKGNKPVDGGNFKGILSLSLFLNCVAGPLVMFFLAIACLPDRIQYVRGLILIGLARCIAMVIVWNDLASGSSEYCAVLVSLNSIFQILIYSPYAYLLMSIFLPAFHLGSESNDNISVSFGVVAESVAIYLGIPFGLGISCWLLFNKVLGSGWKTWYKRVFIPYTAPLTLIALLFTIIVMFCLKGEVIVSIPLDVLRVSIPLCLYFFIMFVGSYYLCHRFHFNTPESITLSFTSASNNFELAIAVAIAIFGLDSPEAFAGVIGPLVEVPVMLGFVYLVRYLDKIWPTVKQPSNYSPVTEKNDTIKSILFFCEDNNVLSQMALGWCQYYHGDSIIAYSAGVKSKVGAPEAINAKAVKVMMEHGIDITDFHSKNITDLENISFDAVVSLSDVCCPRYRSEGAVLLNRSFINPATFESSMPANATEEEVLNEYRSVCDEIRSFIRDDLKSSMMAIKVSENSKKVHTFEITDV